MEQVVGLLGELSEKAGVVAQKALEKETETSAKMVLTGILDYRNAFQTFTARRNQQKDLAVELSRAAQKAQTACSALRAFESDRMKETEIFSNKMILAEPLLPLSSVFSWLFSSPCL